MKLSKEEFIREVAETSGYTIHDTRDVFRVVQDLLLKHMRNGDEVRVATGITILGKKSAPKKFYSGFEKRVIELPERINPAVIFTEGVKKYVRGLVDTYEKG